jgi:hypothetical protein
MRARNSFFQLSAAAAVAGLVLGPAAPIPVVAQPSPPQSDPGQYAGDPPVRVGRVAQLSGALSFHTQADTQWSRAALNYPVASGNSYWTEPGAHAMLEVASSRIAIAGGSEVDIGSLDPSGLQATIPQGEVYLQLHNLLPGETWSFQTPRGEVTLQGEGRYGIAAGDTQSPTVVTVLQGAAQVTGPGVSAQLGPNQTATIIGTDGFQASVAPAQPEGFLADMLNRERPPSPPAAPPPPVVSAMPGGEELAAYGSWAPAPDYGQVWYPPVAADWVPYRDGHWAYVTPWGWTWVDEAPWGFAPSHYGRWVQIDHRWAWSPGTAAAVETPVYAPALVTFFGVAAGVGLAAALASGTVGWVPLGPREPYRPWYHASERHVRSLNVTNVTNITNIRNVTINNFINRGAATFVPTSVMTGSRPVRQGARPPSPQLLAASRPLAGGEPIRPTQATAGITPGAARQLNLPPSPRDLTPRPPAPGPAIHPRTVGLQSGAPRPSRPPNAGQGGGPGLVGPTPEHRPARPLPPLAGPNGQSAPVIPGAMPNGAAPGGGPPAEARNSAAVSATQPHGSPGTDQAGRPNATGNGAGGPPAPGGGDQGEGRNPAAVSATPSLRSPGAGQANQPNATGNGPNVAPLSGRGPQGEARTPAAAAATPSLRSPGASQAGQPNTTGNKPNEAPVPSGGAPGEAGNPAAVSAAPPLRSPGAGQAGQPNATGNGPNGARAPGRGSPAEARNPAAVSATPPLRSPDEGHGQAGQSTVPGFKPGNPPTRAVLPQPLGNERLAPAAGPNGAAGNAANASLRPPNAIQAGPPPVHPAPWAPLQGAPLAGQHQSLTQAPAAPPPASPPQVQRQLQIGPQPQAGHPPGPSFQPVPPQATHQAATSQFQSPPVQHFAAPPPQLPHPAAAPQFQAPVQHQPPPPPQVARPAPAQFQPPVQHFAAPAPVRAQPPPQPHVAAAPPPRPQPPQHEKKPGER